MPPQYYYLLIFIDFILAINVIYLINAFDCFLLRAFMIVTSDK